MNRNLYLRLSLLVLALLPLFVLAQPKLRFNWVKTLPPDTVYYPNTFQITYRMEVENVGNDQLTSSCDVMLRYDSNPADSVKFTWVLQNFEVNQKDTIEFNDPIGALGGNRYKGGGNIIVIWPKSDNPGVQAPDTTGVPIYIFDINAVLDPAELRQRVEVFPNPVQDHLNIRYLQPGRNVGYVRIVGLDGRIYWEKAGAMESLDLSALPAGMYMVVFDFKDGSVGAQRFTKPN